MGIEQSLFTVLKSAHINISYGGLPSDYQETSEGNGDSGVANMKYMNLQPVQTFGIILAFFSCLPLYN